MKARRTGDPAPHVAVIGAGWAGLAAAVAAVRRGWRVSLYEMAHQAGGRARSVVSHQQVLDNGQHILIGAYRQTLALMGQVGVAPSAVLHRSPLALVYPDGHGLQLGHGPTPLAFATAVARATGWAWQDKAALLRAGLGWFASGFDCPPGWTVAQWARGLPSTIRQDLIEPLCVAALNTPMDQASARVLLRVLHDTLFSGPGSADLLLPARPLSQLLPEPASRWLARQGAALHLGHRVQAIGRTGGHAGMAGWLVDAQPVDAVVLAATAVEAARLTAGLAPGWHAQAAAIHYEPIITVWLQDAFVRLPRPMVALQASGDAPAQYAFDLGALGQAPGLFSLVVSGAAPWVARGLEATAQAVRLQAHRAFGHPGHPAEANPAAPFMTADAVRHIAAERRATFACTPGLVRPPQRIAPGLVAAGDYVEGPYPATLEGAVRSGLSAINALADGG